MRFVQECAAALVAHAQQLLSPDAGGEINAAAVAELLEGAVSAVPAGVLEAVVLGGRTCPEARVWRERMTADLVSPKVSELLRELHRHKAPAAEALQQVCLL